MNNVKTVLQNLGDLIFSLRKRENLSQSELAVLMNVSRLTIAKIEKGKNVNIINILNVLKYFNLLDNLNTFIEKEKENLFLTDFNLYE